MLCATRFVGARLAHSCKKTCCQNCHLEQPHRDCEFFCKKCHKLLPVDIDDYFSLFDQPRSFRVDLAKLERSYKGYQRQVHPDRFFRSSAAELQNADRVSCCINEGYRVLRDPVRRGEYMLGLLGKGASRGVPQEFLVEVIDIHEQIEAAERSSPALAKLLDSVGQMLKREEAQLAENLEVVGGSALRNPDGASENLAKMKYLHRIANKIGEKRSGAPAAEEKRVV